MIMSQAEIAAAKSALRARRPRHERWDSAEPPPPRGHDVPELLSACADRLPLEVTYRDSLVSRLQRCVGNGTYAPPAGEIVDQLLGRLTAAALPI